MSKKLILPYLTPTQAAEQALEEVKKERTGEQYGLLCRYHSVNVAMGKYWRFNNVNLIAGLSGHGKSYLLNTFTEDYLDTAELNNGILFIPICLHFCFEMSAYNEILRSCAADLGISYSALLSSEYDKESKTYNTLTDEEFIKVEKYLSYYKKKNIIFIETSGNIRLIYNTIEHFYNVYNDRAHALSIQHNKPIKFRFIVNIDHTLLIDTLDEKSALELMSNVGRYAIKIRKEFMAMVNLLGQLNNNIEDVKRITTKTLHYPQKSDIYAQGQIYNACDNVWVIHQPQLLKIEKYGKFELPTKDLIHFIKLKSRHGKVGSVWLKDNLKNGNIIEYPKKEENNEEYDKNDVIKEI